MSCRICLTDAAGRSVDLALAPKRLAGKRPHPLENATWTEWPVENQQVAKRAKATVTIDLDQLKMLTQVLARAKSVRKTIAEEANGPAVTPQAMGDHLERQMNLMTDCQRDLVRAIGGQI